MYAIGSIKWVMSGNYVHAAITGLKGPLLIRASLQSQDRCEELLASQRSHSRNGFAFKQLVLKALHTKHSAWKAAAHRPRTAARAQEFLRVVCMCIGRGSNVCESFFLSDRRLYTPSSQVSYRTPMMLMLLSVLLAAQACLGLTLPQEPVVQQTFSVAKYMSILETRLESEISESLETLSPLWTSELQTPADIQAAGKDLGRSLIHKFTPIVSNAFASYYSSAATANSDIDLDELAQSTLKSLSYQWRVLSLKSITSWVNTRLRAPPTSITPNTQEALIKRQVRKRGSTIELSEAAHNLGKAGKIMGVVTLTIMFLAASSAVALIGMLPISHVAFRV